MTPLFGILGKASRKSLTSCFSKVKLSINIFYDLMCRYDEKIHKVYIENFESSCKRWYKLKFIAQKTPKIKTKFFL